MENREEIIATLRAHRAELEALGVRHAALFGSHARGDAGPDSDIDVAVEFDQALAQKGLAYFGLQGRVEDRIAELFDTQVDLTDQSMMRPALMREFARERLNVF